MWFDGSELVQITFYPKEAVAKYAQENLQSAMAG